MRISKKAREETRTRILERAAELFGGKGFEETTTRDIATAVGLATGTLFNYFPTKETLAMTLVTDALERASEDHRSRRRGDEDLTEELFLFVASGLRRLSRFRSFLGPVFERSLSPFPRRTVCPEGEIARGAQLGAVGEILERHGFEGAPDHVAMTMYWSLYLGILAFWTNDGSPNQDETRALIDYSVRLFVHVVSGDLDERGEDHVA